MTKKTESAVPERLTDGYLALLMTVLVFACSSGGYLAINEVKQPVFFWLCGGYIALTLLLCAEELLVGRRSPVGLRDMARASSWAARLLLVYLFFTLLSALCSPYGGAAWLGATRGEGAVTIGLYVVSCLLAARFGRPKVWHLHLLAATLTVQTVICILQLHGGNPLGLYPEGVGWADAGKLYSGAYLGTIGNTDFLGAYFSLSVPLLLAGLLRLKTRLRFAWLPGIVLALYVIARMEVRSCVVGVLVGCAAAFPIILPASAGARKRAALGIGAAAIAAVAVLFAVDLPAGPLHTIHEALHGRVARTVDSGRLYIWQEVLRRVPEHPLLGTGPDTMSFAGIEPFRRFDEALNMELVGRIDTAHNQYLNVLYHQGVFALASELAALFAAAAFWVRTSRENAAAAILGTALLCFAVQAFFNISTFFVAPLFWAALGLLIGCRERNKTNRKRGKKA